MSDEALFSLACGQEGIDWGPRRTVKVEVYRAEERRVMAGDLLRWTRNDRDLGRRNGELVRVLSVNLEKATAVVQGAEKAESLDLRGLQHWEHGYASTVYAAQGKTADRVLVHLDGKFEKTVGSESFYVAVSRARHEAKLYTDSQLRLAKVVGRSQQQPYALQAIAPMRGR
jgi:ATP-dependent exoDNAse (exonuclease V) alpha subunit